MSDQVGNQNVGFLMTWLIWFTLINNELRLHSTIFPGRLFDKEKLDLNTNDCLFTNIFFFSNGKKESNGKNYGQKHIVELYKGFSYLF